MRAPTHVLLGLMTLSIGATAVAISAPLARQARDDVKPIVQDDVERDAHDIVIRTQLSDGQIQQLNGEHWVDLPDVDRTMINDPTGDFDRSGIKEVNWGETEDVGPMATVEKVTYEYRYRRAPAFYFQPRYRRYPPPAVYAAPTCAPPPYGPGPCLMGPAYVYAPPPRFRYDVYRPLPAYRFAPYRTYRSNGFYYRHFRRW